MSGYGSDATNPNYVESVASLNKKTKEKLRLDQIVPSEILNDSGETGIKQMLEKYYDFMNMNEFIYTDDETYNDLIASNRAVFRIIDPRNENNEFFSDSTGGNSTLTIVDSTGANVDFDLTATNITISNGNEMPGSLANLATPIGKTFSVSIPDVKKRSAALTAVVNSGGQVTGFTGDFGYQYPSVPTVTLSAPVGGGTQATVSVSLETNANANPYLDTLGSLNIDITNPGGGYNQNDIPTVTITENANADTVVFTPNGLDCTLLSPITHYVGPGPSYVLNAIEEALNIDANTDNYLELMQKEIAAAIPRNITVDKRNLYKNITDFYKLKGSSDSIEIFFRLLFDENVEVTFPFDQTLIPSSGNFDTALGQYLDKKGFLSDTIKLQDSKFYQKFSYVVRTGKNLKDWEAAFDKLVHPAGFIFFGEILLLTQLTRAALGDNIRSSATEVDIGFPEGNTGEVPVPGSPGFVYTYKDLYTRENRKTLSSMPGLQLGVIGIEDLKLLVDMFAATFMPTISAKIHKTASLSANIVGGVIDSISIVDPGFGYTSAPTLTITGTGGAGATATCTIDSLGQIDSVSVGGGGGNSYISAAVSATANPSAQRVKSVDITNITSNKQYFKPPLLELTAPTSKDQDGNLLPTNINATAKAIMTATSIKELRIVNRGSGYTSDPTVTISGNASGIEVDVGSDGRIAGVKLNNGGSGYTELPTITVSGGGGTGCVIEAILEPTSIDSVQIINAGFGYVVDPLVKIKSTTGNEERVENVKKILILALNHAATEVNDPSFRTLINNNYFNRKGNNFKSSARKFHGGYPINSDFFSDKTIENLPGTIINRFNNKAFIAQE